MAQVSGLVIRIDDGETLHQVGVAIDVFGRGLRDMNALWRDMTVALETWQQDAFDSEGSSNAGRWADLSDKYAEQKAFTHPGTGILERTGDMKEALTAAESPFAVREVSGDGMQFVFGTQQLDYPGYHVTGTDKMPRRNPFIPSDNLERDMVDILEKHGGRAARKARLKYTPNPVGTSIEFSDG